jgi:hypothetical protein
VIAEVKEHKDQPAPALRRNPHFYQILGLSVTMVSAGAAIAQLVLTLTAANWLPTLLALGASLGGTVALSALVIAAKKRLGADWRSRASAGVAAISLRSLTGLAAFLAGREGPNLLGESAAHLRGENGHDPIGWAKVSDAAEWVITGVRYRGQDWADAAWRPVDAALRSRFLSGLFVAVPTIVVAFEVLTHKGAMTVLTSWGSIFCVGTGLAASIKGGRKYRDVQPPEPKARRADE